MKQARGLLQRRQFWLAVILSGGIAVAGTFAQTKPAGPPSAATSYDYVGVGGSLVRVEKESGRVEILEQRNSPGMSLTLEQGRPWTWREIRVDNRAGRPTGQDGRGGGQGVVRDGD